MAFRKSCGDTLRKLQSDHKQKEGANRKMLAYLMELLENDKIDNPYDQEFIRSVEARMNADLPLTIKQQEHLDRCYHDRY